MTGILAAMFPRDPREDENAAGLLAAYDHRLKKQQMGETAQKALEYIATKSWPVRLGQSAIDGMSLPHDVMTGEVPYTGPGVSGMTDEEFARVMELAGRAMQGSIVGPAQANALGMGVRGQR